MCIITTIIIIVLIPMKHTEEHRYSEPCRHRRCDSRRARSSSWTGQSVLCGPVQRLVCISLLVAVPSQTHRRFLLTSSLHSPAWHDSKEHCHLTCQNFIRKEAQLDLSSIFQLCYVSIVPGGVAVPLAGHQTCVIHRSLVQVLPGYSTVALGKLLKHLCATVPLSPSSITWNWSKDGDALRLGRWP